MNESLDSRQLKAFVMLAKTGSYTETAKQLYLTHSAISHSMRALEEQVGCRLLAKLSKKVMLTEAGEALLAHAERVLTEMRQARITLAELNKWGSRRLRLAAETIFPSDFLTPVLLQFHREFPESVIQLGFCPAGQAATLLENREADLVLAAKPATTEAVEFRPLFADRFHLVASALHPLSTNGNVSRKDFADYACLLLQGCGHERKTLENALFERGITLKIAGEVENLETVKGFIKNTPLLSLLPGWVIAPELKNGSLVSLPWGKKPIEQSWGLVHARARTLNHAESMFWKFCGRQISTLNS
jgi:DNA-binding transcriptional LysR family regulator